MYKITTRHLGVACKKRLFHSSTSFHKTIQPGFFNSFLSNDTEQSTAVLSAYPIKTSKDTYDYDIPPVASRMLVREFIDDSLYNPQYGFYSKNNTSVLSEYEEMEQEEDQIQYLRRVVKSRGRVHHHHIHQLRYTLTELFKVRRINIQGRTIKLLKKKKYDVNYSHGMVMLLQNIWFPNIN